MHYFLGFMHSCAKPVAEKSQEPRFPPSTTSSSDSIFLSTMTNEAIVFYPAPGIGHIVPMIELTKLINRRYNHRFTTIVLVTTSPFETTTATEGFIARVSKSNTSISFVHFPRKPVDTSPTRSITAMLFESIRLRESDVYNSLKELSESLNVRAFIVDMFCVSTMEIARDLKIPTYCFFPSGAAGLAAFLYIPTIDKEVSSSFKDMEGEVLRIPGLPPLLASQMPEPVLDRKDPAYSDIINFSTHIQKSTGILCNTFDALEPIALSAIRKGYCVPDMPTPHMYTIGPLIATENDIEKSKDGATEDRHECLKWLDKQPSRSVVFLCFGSKGVFTRAQMEEMANGLERSGQRFLWVVRNPIEADMEEILPEGFGGRTKDKGLLVKSWAPQVEVLSHDSVGGFVTHCGWNSVLEAVVAGKPMLAWPLYAEQHMNKATLVEDMKMAIGVEQREGDGFVSGNELARRLGELMDSENGRELRLRLQMMREKALAAWGEGGTSSTAMDKLFNIWLTE